MAGLIVQSSTVLTTSDTTIPNLGSRLRSCKQGCTSAIVEYSQGRQAFPNRLNLSESKWLTVSSPWTGNSVGSAKYRSVRSHRRYFKVSAIAEPPTKTPELESPPTENLKEAKFDWNKQWYPVAIVKDLEKHQPLAITVIGRPLAVWWDKSTNKWQVYADKCPHRLAPLSEGSITNDGELRCSYHGWAFRGDSGECTHIPQADSSTQQHKSKRACVSVYPSIEQQGLIWFWPDLSQGAINIEAAGNPPPVFPELDDPTYAFDMAVRECEYGYDILVENLLDPSHAVFAHHKMQGRREEGGPMNLKVESKITASGFEGSADFGPYSFAAPCTIISNITYPPEISIRMSLPGEHSENFFTHALFVLLTSLKTRFSKDPTPNQVAIIFFCIPVSPGRSRAIWSFPRNFATSILRIVPKWMLHRNNNLVFDSDMLLLHLLDRRLEHEGLSGYYAPTKADALVLGFRKWLNNFAGAPDWGGHFQSNKLPPTPPKRELLDRYRHHVKYCKGCRTALEKFKALEFGLQVLAVALVGVVAASAAAPLPKLQPLSVPLVCGAVLSAILARWLSHFIFKTFYFHDYNHAVVD